MRFLSGFLTGVLFLILLVFLVDNFDRSATAADPEPRKIVNWDVATTKISRVFGRVQEEVRDEVHDATR